MLPSNAMLRERRRAPRIVRRQAALAVAALALATAAGCGIKGPLKRVDATPAQAAPAPATPAAPADPAKPRLP